MNADEIRAAVRQFVEQELLHGEDRGVDATTPLLEWGIIESLSLMSLLTFLERHFELSVPDSEMLPDNFQNLNTITDLVLRLKSQRAAG